jgi:ADP-ribosylglycohydrolase
VSIKRSQNSFRGCLVGGAIGDALGWPVEFLKYRAIQAKFGEEGITNLVSRTTGKAEITDDTQMTLFTAEGLLRAQTRGHEKGICHVPSVVYFAYLRWLHTQGYSKNKEQDWVYDGWLINVKELYHPRAPGNSCLSALESGRLGTVDQPINNSKGCGGVMRVAPIGLLYPMDQAFEMAVDCAALTHGHPSGYLSAGALAYIISAIINGEELEVAISNSLIELKKYDGHEECSVLIEKAIELSQSNVKPLAAISKLGEGWVGEEALAISIYCALTYKTDFKAALVAAVNHDGDSDSTGAITGNILGAYLGIDNLPSDWIDQVELTDVLVQVADDLHEGYNKSEDWWLRYPGH